MFAFGAWDVPRVGFNPAQQTVRSLEIALVDCATDAHQCGVNGSGSFGRQKNAQPVELGVVSGILRVQNADSLPATESRLIFAALFRVRCVPDGLVDQFSLFTYRIELRLEMH